MSSTLLYINMNQEKGQGRYPDRGRGHGCPPTNFNDATIATLFDSGIPDSIHREVLAMQEVELHWDHPML